MAKGLAVFRGSPGRFRQPRGLRLILRWNLDIAGVRNEANCCPLVMRLRSCFDGAVIRD
jgi:hypothetical protein